MEQPLHILWTYNGRVLHGLDLADATWKDDTFNFGVGFPDKITEARELQLQSSARRRRSYDILTGVELYLTGDPQLLSMITELWPALGCGIDLSQDGGATFQLIRGRVPLLASAVGMDAQDGELGPFDTARLVMRARIPGSYQEYGRLKFGLAIDCDVI